MASKVDPTYRRQTSSVFDTGGMQFPASGNANVVTTRTPTTSLLSTSTRTTENKVVTTVSDEPTSTRTTKKDAKEKVETTTDKETKTITFTSPEKKTVTFTTPSEPSKTKTTYQRQTGTSFTPTTTSSESSGGVSTTVTQTTPSFNVTKTSTTPEAVNKVLTVKQSTPEPRPYDTSTQSQSHRKKDALIITGNVPEQFKTEKSSLVSSVRSSFIPEVERSSKISKDYDFKSTPNKSEQLVSQSFPVFKTSNEFKYKRAPIKKVEEKVVKGAIGFDVTLAGGYVVGAVSPYIPKGVATGLNVLNWGETFYSGVGAAKAGKLGSFIVSRGAEEVVENIAFGGGVSDTLTNIGKKRNLLIYPEGFVPDEFTDLPLRKVIAKEFLIESPAGYSKTDVKNLESFADIQSIKNIATRLRSPSVTTSAVTQTDYLKNVKAFEYIGPKKDLPKGLDWDIKITSGKNVYASASKPEITTDISEAIPEIFDFDLTGTMGLAKTTRGSSGEVVTQIAESPITLKKVGVDVGKIKLRGGKGGIEAVSPLLNVGSLQSNIDESVGIAYSLRPRPSTKSKLVTPYVKAPDVAKIVSGDIELKPISTIYSKPDVDITPPKSSLDLKVKDVPVPISTTKQSIVTPAKETVPKVTKLKGVSRLSNYGVGSLSVNYDQEYIIKPPGSPAISTPIIGQNKVSIYGVRNVEPITKADLTVSTDMDVKKASSTLMGQQGKVATVSRRKQDRASTSIVDMEQNVITSIKMDVNTKTDQQLAVKQVNLPMLKMSQKTATKTREKSLLKSRNELKPTNVTVPKFSLPFLNESSKPSPYSNIGFIPSVRRGGKFVPLTTVPLSYSSAKALGAREVERTPRATFKLTKVSGRPSDIKVPYQFRAERFRSPVRRGVPITGEEVYVEKSRYRINAPGELKGITFKGIQAPRKKKGKRKKNLLDNWGF